MRFTQNPPPFPLAPVQPLWMIATEGETSTIIFLNPSLRTDWAVGRVPDAQIVLRNTMTSWYHGDIRFVPGNGYDWEDLESTNGSVVRNGDVAMRCGRDQPRVRYPITVNTVIELPGVRITFAPI